MLIHTDKKAYVVFSLWLRIFHWTMVLSVTALFWTGLYIGDPGFAAITGNPEPTFAIDGWFSMETMRRIHFIAGVILIGYPKVLYSNIVELKQLDVTFYTEE